MAPVREGAIRSIGYAARERALIEKAVEVVRREPYCSFVLKVDYAGSVNDKSTVLVVRYVNSEGEELQVQRKPEELDRIDIEALKSCHYVPGRLFRMGPPKESTAAG